MKSSNGLQNNPTPPDMKTFVEMTARSVAKHGLEFEKSIMNITPNDARVNLNFLKCSDDALHGYYQQKLTEYLSQNQEDEIIYPPSGLTRAIIVETARQLSRKGLADESEMMAFYARKPGSSFLRSSHHHHAFFQQKLTEFRSQNQQDGAYQDDDDDDDDTDEALRFQPHFILLPDLLQIRLPKGMKMKEFVTLKLTAQFAAWYGDFFWLKLTEKPGFEFTNSTDSNFARFFRFVIEYSKVFSPPKDLEEKMRKSDSYAAAVQDGFFRLLQWDGAQELEWRAGGVMSMVNWHASLEKGFANEHVEPELKRRPKFDESATLVPEDQFLARYSGLSTIKVSICKVIEITLESLSENVASLKDKVAAEIRIPAERLKLYGSAGLLEDNNRSLAHYNVVPGGNLTLSFCKSLF